MKRAPSTPLEEAGLAKRLEVSSSSTGAAMPTGEMVDDAAVPEPSQKEQRINMLMEHMDEELNPVAEMTYEETEFLAQHDWEMTEEDEDDEEALKMATKELTYPWSLEEPQLDYETLSNLDALADDLEMKRLLGLGVLLKDDEMAEVAIDIKDAFLTVDQKVETKVRCKDALGREIEYSLGKVLPGQRDGSLLWFESLAEKLKKIDLEANISYPCLFKSPDNMFLMVQVDDVLAVGRKDDIFKKLVPMLKETYSISIEAMLKPGDELNFLKKAHCLLPDGRMLIKPHPKHVGQLCHLLKLNPKIQCKKSPAHTDLETLDVSEKLDPEEATTYRSCVGTLQYLANDVPHAQFVIRYLATRMKEPTKKSVTILKHLASYLSCHEVVPSLKWHGRLQGLFHSHEEPCIEVYSDADWAADKTDRRSISGCTIYISGSLVYSASRTQKVIPLSSAESETYAAASATSDGIFLKNLWSWITRQVIGIKLYLDSAAARGILMRQGVGRVRHLHCKVLWMQQLTKDAELSVKAVSGILNPADVGTKRLPTPRMQSLMYLLGLWNIKEEHLEGDNDPGRIFTRPGVQPPPAQIMMVRATLGALGFAGLQLQGCEFEEKPMHEFGFYEYFMTILVGLVMICIGWSMINYPGVAQMIAQETQEAIMDLPNAWMNLGDGQGQQPPEEAENEPMEVEPEGLQGIWADPGPPVMMRARAAGRGRGRGRPRGRPARGRARGPPQQAPFPQVPQQAEEPEEPINHPGAPGVVFPADMTYGDISQALVDETNDLMTAQARSVEDLFPGLREFREEAAEFATGLLEPQMDTADEGEGEEEERQEEEMESEVETDYGSVELALEAQVDYMHTTLQRLQKTADRQSKWCGGLPQSDGREAEERAVGDNPRGSQVADRNGAGAVLADPVGR